VEELRMPVPEDGHENLNWRKATLSLNHGACAEVANGRGIVMMRDSKDPQGPVLEYSGNSWRFFVASAKLNGFEVPVVL
jgi:hypothetical protein